MNELVPRVYAGQLQQATVTPTALALLEAIARSESTLTQVSVAGKTVCQLSPLPATLLDILRYLHPSSPARPLH